ncbi:hypothetical protein D9615_002182 [Tricholomella constricta]|uniref:Uncharacterized protein n=1 Tax=Tricholomella constricta TaxID=117010 RepID=A0A8H5M9W1_9AGAR|nr:hypothetical protein D9615_002182 [Tricholomella constricta]
MAPSRSQLPQKAQNTGGSDSRYACVQEFFGYKPRELTASFGATESTSTNAPGPFTKHLDEKLRLRRVFKLPSIPSDLAQVAQEALDGYPPGELPPINRQFPTPEARQNAIAHSGEGDMVSEKGVENSYAMTTARYCSTVAGTLVFRLSEWSSGSLKWRLEPIHAPRKNPRNKALADGYLNLVKDDATKKRSETPSSLHGLVDTFPVLSSFEFKNLNFADKKKVFEEIPSRFSNDWFPWEGCELGEACRTTHIDVGVNRCPMGWDAEKSPCPSFKTARRANSTRSYGPLPEVNSNFGQWALERGYPVGARYILQQAWTQAVLHDATFLVINAGNIEIIGIRDRQNQTLYVSDAIGVPNCKNYGQIHTGLYIAAVLDAGDRALQLRRSKPESWDVESGIDAEKILDLTRCDKKTALKVLWTQATTRAWLKVSPARDTIVHHPYAKDSLYQRLHLKGSPPPLADTDTLIKVAAHDTVRGSLTVCSGTLEIPGAVLKRSHTKITLIIKSALNRSDEVSRLTKEYQAYLAFNDAGVTGIPKVVGFFGYSGDDPYKTYTALVLEDVGQSLEELKEEVGDPSISREQLADYLHGNLTERSLMFKTNGAGKPRPLCHTEVSIVGFSNAVRLPSDPGQREKLTKEELATLQRLWTNPLKRKEPVLRLHPIPKKNKNSGVDTRNAY